MRITFESPNQPDIVRLIEELDAYQKPLYPAESHHGLDINALELQNVLFAVARNSEGKAVACGAILITQAYGELKRMYVVPSVRGKGIGRALLQALEAAAKAKGCSLFTLETGYLQPEAISLYAKAGYVRCGPFGSYAEDPNSVFMCKSAG
jgi:putative acetyltransferase